MILDLIGGVVLMGSVLLVLNAFLDALGVTVAARRWLSALAGLWIGLQVSLYTAGAFQSDLSLDVPVIGFMVALPPLVVLAAAMASARMRNALLSVPMPLLVGLNAVRIVGGLFVVLALAGRLDGPFPHVAGWGDVLVAVLALPLARRLAAGTATSASVARWNALGAADLVAAVTLGTLSTDGFAFQIFSGDPGSTAVQHMPWLLIPTVLVPFFLVVHGIIAAKLRLEQARPLAA